MKVAQLVNTVQLLKKRLDKIAYYCEKLDPNSELYQSTFNAEIFFTIISMDSAQSKAPAAEKFLEKKLLWKKIKASENRGDFYDDKNDKFIELKMSFNNKANTLNFRQIRLWQKIDYYLGIYIDEDNIKNSLVFKIPHEEMKQIIANNGCATHGTSVANELNINIEYSYSLPLANKELLAQWKEKYFDTFIYNQIFNSEENYEN